MIIGFDSDSFTVLGMAHSGDFYTRIFGVKKDLDTRRVLPDTVLVQRAPVRDYQTPGETKHERKLHYRPKRWAHRCDKR